MSATALDSGPETLVLGYKPQEVTVRLTRDAGFAVTLVRTDPDGQPLDWDAASAPSLVFGGGAQWATYIEGNEATFAEPRTSVNAAIDSNEGTRTVTLMSGAQMWARGWVEVYG